MCWQKLDEALAEIEEPEGEEEGEKRRKRDTGPPGEEGGSGRGEGGSGREEGEDGSGRGEDGEGSRGEMNGGEGETLEDEVIHWLEEKVADGDYTDSKMAGRIEKILIYLNQVGVKAD